MIDFDKLNAMIDEVHNVISDVKEETKDIESKIFDIKNERYDKAVADLIEYCNVLTKAHNNFSNGRNDIKIRFEDNGAILFTRLDRYNDIWNSYGVKVMDKHNAEYTIIDSTRGESLYGNINHSHPSVIWFENLIKDWDNVKNFIEPKVIDGVNIILKSQSEIAHKNNLSAKSKLNSEIEF